jgi:primase-polymerase (primpol)-like protein
VKGNTPKKSFYASPDQKPNVIQPDLESIPCELKKENRWVLWRLVWSAKKKTWDKIPYQANGRKAQSNNPKTWTSFEAAVAAYQTGEFDGFGFMLGDGFVGVDLDNVFDQAKGEITSSANQRMGQSIWL